MRNLSVVSVRCINGIVFSFAHITCIRFLYLEVCFAFSISFKLFLLLLPLRNEIIEPRVRASSIIWRV